MVRFLYVVPFILFFSCSERSIESDVGVNTSNGKVESLDLDSCYTRIYKEGDVECYELLLNEKNEMLPSDRSFLAPSVIMANMHNYPKANLDVFNLILMYYTEAGIEGLNLIDASTKELMLKYLNRASINGVEDAQYMTSIIEADSIEYIEDWPTDNFHFYWFEEHKVMFEGDQGWYSELYWKNKKYPRDEDILFWSLYMANRYDYDMAYFHVFECFYLISHSCFENDFQDLDSTTRKFALDYLQVAVDRDIREAKDAYNEVMSSLMDVGDISFPMKNPNG